MYEYLELLRYIAKRAGPFGSLKISTLRISKDISDSQQTISRKLREMEQQGLIKRATLPTGLLISLNEGGRKMLQGLHHDLKDIFTTKVTEISGKVVTGIGEGAYYVSQKGYDFEKVLGFNPYPGTLNVEVVMEELAGFEAGKEPIEVKGFKTDRRTFGGITCYPIQISSVKGVLVKPHRGRHPEGIVEVIAPVNIREELHLVDGSVVKIK